MAQVTWAQVHAFRLRRHHLTDANPPSGVVAVARDIGGAQAQVMSAAEMQIAARSRATAADVRHALWEDRSLVKTWLMRGTLHLVPADDLPLYAAAMQGSWIKARNSWLNYLQITEVEMMRLIDAIAAAMDGTPVTRQEILARVGSGHSERVRETLRSGWGGMLKPVARRGLLCFGPSRGQTVTFVNPRRWLPSWREVDPDDAIAEIARRYLRAYGPATRNDFARWWGMWPGAARAAWSRLSPELASVSVEGAVADVLTDDLDALSEASIEGSAVLLPTFDPYVMGHTTRDHLLEKVHASRVSRTAGWISAVVLVDGRAEGTWTHSIRRGALHVDVAPFRRLPAWATAEIRRRARALAAAAGVPRSEVRISRRAGPS